MRSALSRRCATNAAVGQARGSRNSNYGNIGVGAGAAATILSIYHDLASAALALAGGPIIGIAGGEGEKRPFCVRIVYNTLQDKHNLI
jgi:hypothetical protein